MPTKQACGQNSKSRCGVALIELALILPIVLALFLGAVEFGLQLRVKLQAVRLSKELGDAIFRMRDSVGGCWQQVADDSTAPDTTASTCLSAVATSMTGQVALVNSKAKARLQIWRCKSAASGGGIDDPLPSSGATNPTVATIKITPAPSQENTNTKTNFVTGDFSGTADSNLGKLCANTSPMITAEVYIPYTPLIGFFPSFFNASAHNGYLYASTIY